MDNASKFDERERDLPNVAGMTFRQIGARWGVSGSRAMQLIRMLKERADIRERRARTPHPLTDEWLLEDMALSPRTRNCLRNDGIKTVGDVRAMTDRELMTVPNFGRKSLHELRGAIREGFTPKKAEGS